MDTIIAGAPHVPIMTAARELETTHLRVLMLLKHTVVAGVQVDGEWYIERGSLDALKNLDSGPGVRAACRRSCRASSCGCRG